jgi:putative peptidoglycan lipid II flippase
LSVTALATLASRILGLVRDAATAALLGLDPRGVMDAFAVAFRWPDLMRRLLVEGTLSAAFLPQLVRYEDTEPQRAGQFTRSFARYLVLAMLLASLVLGLGALATLASSASTERDELAAWFLLILLPYAVMLAAIAPMAAVLQVENRFSVPALSPILLNLMWLAGAGIAAWLWSGDAVAQAVVLCWAILAGGVVQWLWHWLALRRSSSDRHRDLQPSVDPLVARQARRTLVRTGWVAVALGAAQVNIAIDSLLAWWWMSDPASNSLATGAAGALYFGERLYQFPLAIIGSALATVLFPTLSRHASRGDTVRLSDDLTHGLRLAIVLGIPASVGLALVAAPLTDLILARGAFGAEDAARTAGVVVAYALGVAAQCGVLICLRGLLAQHQLRGAVILGLVSLPINVLASATLVGPFQEAGIAAGTSIASFVQLLGLVVLLTRRSPLHGRSLIVTLAQSLLATAMMSGVVLAAFVYEPSGGTLVRIGWLMATITLAAVCYGAVLMLVGLSPRALLKR